jgi:hypothetical protein
MSKAHLQKIFQDTEAICASIKNLPTKSEVFYQNVIDEYTANNNGIIPEIKVINADTLDTMLQMYRESFQRPLVLNMASDICPGGGVRSGAMAQEECICRRSSLYPALTGLKNKFNYKLYPFKSSIDRDLETNRSKREYFNRMTKEARNYDGKDVAIYTKDVVLLRDSDYSFLPNDQRVLFDVISIAGIRHPVLDGSKLNDVDEDTLRMKIYQIMSIANLQNHDCVILGALGCGAFRGPPQHIAAIFREVLNEFRFTSVKSIVFAVLSRNGCVNYDIFKRTLGT